jgi:hypothetical protein
MAGAQDWSNALWDETAVYDLTVEIVNQFLRETFGNWDFFTKVYLVFNTFSAH